MQSRTSQAAHPRAQAGSAAFVAATAAAYYILALACIYLSRQPGSIATVWYANAIAVIALLQWPRHSLALLGAVAVADFAANVSFGDPAGLAAAFVLPNLAEIALSAHLLRRYVPPHAAVSSAPHLLLALAVGAAIPTAVGATVGAATIALTGFAPYGRVWLSWFLGSLIGSISLLPLGWIVLVQGKAALHAAMQWRSIGFFVIVAAVSVIAPLGAPSPYVYIAVTLVLAAMLLPFAASALAGLIASAIVATLIATGRFAPPPVASEAQQLLFYVPLLLALVPALLLAAAQQRSRDVLARLAASEAQFRALYVDTPALLQSLELDGRIVSVSNAWLDALGFARGQVIERPFADFLAERSRPAFAEALDALRRNGHVRDVALAMVRKDGAVRDALLSAIVRPGPEGRARILAVLEDVTDKRTLEQALARQSADMRLVVDNVPSMLAFWTSDLVNRFANRAYVDWFGRTPQQIIGTRLPDLLGPDLYEKNRPYIERALAGEMQTFEREIPSPTGGPSRHSIASYIPHRDANGKVDGFFVIVTDITERRKAEMRIAESEERLRQTMEAVGDGLICTDVEGRVEYLNPAAERLTGWSSTEARGRLLGEVFVLMNEQTRAPLASPVARCLREGAVVWLGGALLVGRSGEAILVDDCVAPIRDRAQRIVGTVLVFRDVTVKRQLEKAELAREAAERANHAKTDFLSRVSHELRTPLAAVIGYAQVLRLKADTVPAEARRNWVARIEEAALHLRTLIDEILDLSRIESGNISLDPVDLDVAALIDESLSLEEPHAERRNIVLARVNGTGSALGVHADKTRLRQILLNLVSNAIKYNREGGRVEVEVREAGERVEIRVRDTGIGMNEQQLAELFQPFNRLGREASGIEGTGMGLAVSRALAQAMHGDLTAASTPDVGSEFCVTLPAVRRPTVP